MLTEDDHKRIASAIEDVEQKTDGDIYCLVAHEVSQYREVPLAWAAIVALLVPPLLLLLFPPKTLFLLGLEWTAVQSTFAEHQIVLAISEYALVQAILFAFVALIVSIPWLRGHLTPGFVKRHRVRQAARQHFVSTGTHLPPGTPHILIFLALSERQVEVLADAAIHNAAGAQVWNDTSAAVAAGMREPDPTSGIVRAIGIAGGALIQHFPKTHTRAAAGEQLGEV